MASIIPRTHAAFLLYLEAQAPVWEERAGEIGITPAEGAGVLDLLAAAKEAQFKRVALEAALRAAVDMQEAAFGELRGAAGALVARVRAYAEASDDPHAVYQAARIPPPRAGGGRRVPPPAQPRDLRVAIIPATGALELTWKATNPAGASGTSYIVRRRAEGETEFMFVGVTGEKRFVDATLLAGAARVAYTVQGQRGGAGRDGGGGPVSEILTIHFGRQGGSQLGGRSLASVTPSSHAA